MTITFIDPPGSMLASLDAPIRFSSERAVPAVSVRLGDSDLRVEERAYRDGAFVYPYLESMKSGNTFTLVRTGGWPREQAPTVFVDETPAPPVPPISTLQPLNYAANLVAAYAFNEPAAACNLDRSANARNFVTAGALASDMMNVPDLMPGKAAIMGAPANTFYTGQPLDCAQSGAHWQLQNELTVTFRWFLVAPVSTITYSPVYCNATPTGTSSVAFQVAVTNNYRLAYYAERSKVGQLFISTAAGLVCEPNRWLFISCRRRADGTVRLGVGRGPTPAQQSYEDSGALQLPLSSVSGSAWFCRFCNNRDSAPTQPGGGPIADFMCWNRFLTDAELEPQYAAAMAGAP